MLIKYYGFIVFGKKSILCDYYILCIIKFRLFLNFFGLFPQFFLIFFSSILPLFMAILLLFIETIPNKTESIMVLVLTIQIFEHLWIVYTLNWETTKVVSWDSFCPVCKRVHNCSYSLHTINAMVEISHRKYCNLVSCQFVRVYFTHIRWSRVYGL